MAVAQGYNTVNILEAPRDVYVNTVMKSTQRPKRFTEATVLHEVLHNMTGLSDEELQQLFGLSTVGDSINITLKLRAVGCAR
jgi:hypothetical protein